MDFDKQQYLKQLYDNEQDPNVKSIIGNISGMGQQMPKSANPVDSIMEQTPWYKTIGGGSALGGALGALGAGLLGQDVGNSLAYGVIGAGKTSNVMADNIRKQEEQKAEQEMNAIRQGMLEYRMKDAEQRQTLNQANISAQKEIQDAKIRENSKSNIVNAVKNGVLDAETANKLLQQSGAEGWNLQNPQQDNQREQANKILNLGNKQALVNPLTGEVIKEYDIAQQQNQQSVNKLVPLNLGNKQVLVNPLTGETVQEYDIAQKEQQAVNNRLVPLDLGNERVLADPLTGEVVKRYNVAPSMPSSIAGYNEYKAMTPEQQAQYQSYARAPQIKDTGGEIQAYNPATMQMTPIATKTLKPEDRPEAVQAKEIAKTTGKEQVERTMDFPKTTNAFNASMAKNERVSNLIDDVYKKINWKTAGGIGKFASVIPGTEASDLKANLDTIEANIGFEELANMRANSPTGGALGAISDRDISLLTSAMANVKQSQSPKQLRDNLASLKTTMSESKERLKKAYESDLKKYGAGAMQGATPQSSITEGATATNPNTGAKIIFRGGKWQAM